MSKYLRIADQVIRDLELQRCDISDESDKSVDDGRWDPELVSRGYVWCLDCAHWGETACGHPDNPFRNQQPLAARRGCQWYAGQR